MSTNSSDTSLAMDDNCWRTVGVFGDRTCPRLASVGHCHNCPKFSRIGTRLFDREPPEGYAREWAALLAQEKDAETKGLLSVVIFRVGGEWLALPTGVFKEVTEVGRVHSIPHRRSEALMGLVNVRGDIQLCVSLARLLGVAEEAENRGSARGAYRRHVTVERGGSRWVFAADEIHGIHRVDPSDVKNVPVTVANWITTYTKGVFVWDDKSVGCLDEELLFSALGRSVS